MDRKTTNGLTKQISVHLLLIFGFAVSLWAAMAQPEESAAQSGGPIDVEGVSAAVCIVA